MRNISEVMKMGNGKFAVCIVNQQTGKATKLAYKKWFNKVETAEVWKQKFNRKMLSK